VKNYEVKLESQPSKTFRCQMAANSLDIDSEKKLTHTLSVSVDTDTNFNVGLILGASGSGKTTLAHEMFGPECFKTYLDPEKTILDQLPASLSYDECAAILSGIGLTAVTCWLRPVKTLSNGQRSRAEAALAMVSGSTVVIDEWTSVVDRTVAKVMSHCVQKFARRNNKKVILLSCHYDVLEWLNPDFVVDCNTQKFIDRRLLSPGERARSERLEFEVRTVDKSTWSAFSKYHYLSEKMPGGLGYFFGLFHGQNQIGFNALSNYVPWADKTKPMIVHSHRTVIHPDYAGMGLGILFDTECCRHIKKTYGYRVLGKFSAIPTFKAMSKHSEWRLLRVDRQIGKTAHGKMGRTACKTASSTSSFRENVKTWTFEFVGN